MADYQRRMAERIEQGMAEKSISRETLAARADVSEKTIKRLLEEKTDNPRPVTIRRIAKALDIAPGELRPPPEVETEQLNRIEAKLDRLLQAAGLPTDFDSIVAELEQEIVGVDQPVEPNASRSEERRPANGNR